MSVVRDASTPVTFRATAVAPADGTPAVLVTGTSTCPPGPTTRALVLRVSRTRCGASGWNSAPPAASSYQPERSAITSTDPAAFSSRIEPPLPTLTMARFGTIWPDRMLRLLAPGGAADASAGVG